MPTGKYIRKPMSEETKLKISIGNKGKPKTDAHKQNMSKARKGNIPWNKGKKGVMPTPWNKGLTKETDERINYNRPTAFKKGNISWCKGTKGVIKPNKTSFKKGNIPPFKGKIIPLEMRRRISLTLTGDKEFTGFKKTEIERIRRSEQYKKWRHNVFERDNYTCQICGIRGAKLIVHHIKNFSSNKNKRFDENNGITLYKKIHEMFHKKYGYQHNTKEQLEKFLNGNK